MASSASSATSLASSITPCSPVFANRGDPSRSSSSSSTRRVTSHGCSCRPPPRPHCSASSPRTPTAPGSSATRAARDSAAPSRVPGSPRSSPSRAAAAPCCSTYAPASVSPSREAVRPENLPPPILLRHRRRHQEEVPPARYACTSWCSPATSCSWSSGSSQRGRRRLMRFRLEHGDGQQPPH
ncbi:predicted GPI-anchored protein 58 [Oryza sativa Japonica Group]|uniref:cDNA clone:002-114-B09, full insert sequence n=1 Tax=Oryza sativa subsp. japonica TaxID=39947 RepID=B7E9U4_ORYSJ|nr:pre-mRNA-splicing factor CWC22 [Oryza sativa Japonica Group]KAF2944448.1 hypothetical protein DAI22_02g143801 [Oryza sativa Japonica Group]BAG89141.1 unnamed protein product [Oryza sativa Japonica Group]